MTTLKDLTSTRDHFVGPSAPIPNDNVFTFCFSNPFQHSPNDFIPPSVKKPSPNHTFEGKIISPHRPSLIHAGTNAILSWQDIRTIILRVARNLHAIIGEGLPWDGKDSNDPIISPESTILVHLPNCLAFPIIFLGEIANVLSKARPQILFTIEGVEGEDNLRKGLQILLDRSERENVGSVSGTEIKRWANELAASWDQARIEKGSVKNNRVWIVDVNSKFNAATDDGSLNLKSARDWLHLIRPPMQVHNDDSNKVGDTFQVRKLSEQEQRRRVLVLLWSSGTTGLSKGVLLSHRNLVASIVGNWVSCPHIYGASLGPFGGGETWIALAPWCHIYGLSTLLLPAFALGATLVLPASPKFDLSTYLRLVTKYRATTMHIAPPVAVILRTTTLLDPSKEESKGIDISSVRTLLSGGAPTPTEVIKAIYQRTGKVLQIGYGATEAGSNAHAVAQDFTADNHSSLEELGSVGAPMGNLEICIRPLESTGDEQTAKRFHEIVEQGELKLKAGECAPVKPSLPGEICLRGPHVFLGYYSGLGSNDKLGAKDVELNKSAMTSDGYYRTGDEGIFDYQGRLWIIGRTKELIKVRGFAVAPAELDALYIKHTEIDDAAAAGMVDANGGEQIVMYIVPRNKDVLVNEEQQKKFVVELAAFIVGKAAHYKWPSYYAFTQSVLKNPTGKVMRKDLHTIKATRHVAPRQKTKSKM